MKPILERAFEMPHFRTALPFRLSNEAIHNRQVVVLILGARELIAHELRRLRPKSVHC